MTTTGVMFAGLRPMPVFGVSTPRVSFAHKAHATNSAPTEQASAPNTAKKPEPVGILPIRLYQAVTQPIYHFLGDTLGIELCIHYRNGRLSCSEYTAKAIQELGFWQGCVAGARRIASCNPVTAYNIETGKLTELKDPVELKNTATVGRLKSRRYSPEKLEEGGLMKKWFGVNLLKGPLYEKYAGQYQANTEEWQANRGKDTAAEKPAAKKPPTIRVKSEK